MIRKIEIKKLFGNADILIKLNKSGIDIFIGENGVGKTTILNIIYYSLTKNYIKLAEYYFEEISITFKSNDNARLMHKDIELLSDRLNTRMERYSNRYINSINSSDVQRITNYVNETKSINYSIIKRMIPKLRNMPSSICEALIDEIIANHDFNNNLNSKMKEFSCKIDKNIKDEGISIIYLPTYRRIEEDLAKLGINLDDDGELEASQLINFGMDDVKQNLRRIRNNILKLANESLTTVSGEMLNLIITGVPPIENIEIDSENIQIILSRIGEAITTHDKEKIIKLSKEGKIKEQNKFLVYFIQKLVESYEEQKIVETKLKKYIDVINKYLKSSKKKIVYDEKNVGFYIESSRFESKPFLSFLSKMSSGEKQIISLFSKIYLPMKDDKFIILFDEPELSLSIDWQESLLPDIVNSKRVENLIAVTHSPFIYDNNLLENAFTLSDSINYNNDNE